MKIDLHTHTNYSDGIYSPAEVVEFAINNKVDVFAITDHDSVFGCEEIQKAAENKAVKIINGMELSTEYKGNSVHIVCLFKKNIIPSSIFEYSKLMHKRREDRAVKMLSTISSYYGLKIDLPKLIANSHVLTRANMSYHLAQMNNISLVEAQKYVSKNSFAYIPSTNLPTEEGINMAKNSGCITILAHPCLLPKDIVSEILEFGLNGIEVRYPKNALGDEQYFTKLAKEKDMFISAGSDFHGDNIKHAMIGTCTLNENEFQIIRERLEFDDHKKS